MSEEVIGYLNARLGLDEFLNLNEKESFLENFRKYFTGNYNKHSVSGVGGRTLETLEQNMDGLCHFLESIGCDKSQIIHILYEAPDLLNVDVDLLYYKYLILGLIPACLADENYRLKHILAKPQDIRTSVKTIYARVRFVSSVGYPAEKISWNLIVHDTEREFVKTFIKQNYSKPYKIFNSEEDYNDYDMLNKYPITEEAIEKLKALKTNEEVVRRYEGEKPQITK